MQAPRSLPVKPLTLRRGPNHKGLAAQLMSKLKVERPYYLSSHKLPNVLVVNNGHFLTVRPVDSSQVICLD
jgi:hypothetical protein